MSCFHYEIIYMVLYRLFSTVDEILRKKVSTLRHFLKQYFLFNLNIIEIQQKIKFMSLNISKVFHPYNTVLKAIKVLQHFENYVSIRVKRAKEIFFKILIALNPMWLLQLQIVARIFSVYLINNFFRKFCAVYMGQWSYKTNYWCKQ